MSIVVNQKRKIIKKCTVRNLSRVRKKLCVHLSNLCLNMHYLCCHICGGIMVCVSSRRSILLREGFLYVVCLLHMQMKWRQDVFGSNTGVVRENVDMFGHRRPSPAVEQDSASDITPRRSRMPRTITIIFFVFIILLVAAGICGLLAFFVITIKIQCYSFNTTTVSRTRSSATAELPRQLSLLSLTLSQSRKSSLCQRLYISVAAMINTTA